MVKEKIKRIKEYRWKKGFGAASFPYFLQNSNSDIYRIYMIESEEVAFYVNDFLSYMIMRCIKEKDNILLYSPNCGDYDEAEKVDFDSYLSFINSKEFLPMIDKDTMKKIGIKKLNNNSDYSPFSEYYVESNE